MYFEKNPHYDTSTVTSGESNKEKQTVNGKHLIYAKRVIQFKVHKVENQSSKGMAGRSFPSHFPKPILTPLSLTQYPRSITVSPSWMNFLSSPDSSLSGFVPFQDNSNMLPNESDASPLIVPEPSRSPGRRLHPVTVCCASCCFTVQYRKR